MRSILVSGGRDPAASAALQTALALGRVSDGHVTVLFDTPVTRFVAQDPFGLVLPGAEILEDALARDDALAAKIESELALQNVPFEVVRSEEELAPALWRAARLADIVVTSRSEVAGDVALNARCPVLILPGESPLAFPPETVCVAFDGGDEASLALRSALPLMHAARAVHVLSVEEKPAGFPATEALRYLSRHGIAAELRELVRDGSTAATLDRAVAELGADLLVMGAFGRSRLREWLLGGVTRHFLEEAVSPPALLLAH